MIVTGLVLTLVGETCKRENEGSSSVEKYHWQWMLFELHMWVSRQELIVGTSSSVSGS
jgi:hypothetical protein